ncbi:RarD protein, DMT superfamily transporter [Crinalium epipsammum PCC 9333]|uniref:RarD protein, DMT superfamily transporter n=1 Tax=Crinalium epipsammum PCC 9333 TaxID=1173022 RepID=K9VVV1_9CYAN|nr:EamA family transporter RarD [Crinalium epipsammum]AFZ11305.1 RarD protein, DMT superfamily transporter [Crinalium epipsammum PCC 9333]
MSSNPHPDSSKAISKTGAIYAVLAYTAWGLLPIYWKFFGQVSESEVLSHRIIWSMIFLTGLVFLTLRSQELHQLFHSPTRLGILLITALLLTFNWGLYIYGVNANRVVETSYCYFINPLVNVLLGFVFLKERLHLGQKLAVLLAVIGVLNFVWDFGEVPWLALGLAFSFAFYGLLRKLVAVAPLIGLAVETLLLAPVALVLIGYWAITGVGHLGVSWSTSLLFIGSGVITSFPLLWFNNAAKRLRLSTLGFFQYLAPSLQLMLGVFLYHEPFTRTHAVTFGFIWVALVIYSTTSLVTHKFS